MKVALVPVGLQQLGIPLLVFLISITGANTSSSSNLASRVSVQIPYPLHNPEGEEHVKAPFGFPSHHGHMGGFVYYTESSLCFGFHKNEVEKNGTVTSPVVYPLSNDGSSNSDFVSPFILMVPSNTAKECSYSTLAREAQLLGASALVLAHDECRCSDQNCTIEFGPTCTSDPVTVVSAEGAISAADITIPTFLLFKVKAQQLVVELKRNHPVMMELSWGLHNNQTLNAEPRTFQHQLWSTAADQLLDVETLGHFKTIATTFYKHGAQFEPKFALFPGKRFGCDQQTEEGPASPCDHLCTNHGRYCALTAYHQSGQSIVNETLRRLCIWQEYGHGDGKNPKDKDTNDGSKYFDYIIYHTQHCGLSKYSDQACLADAYKHSTVDGKIVAQCMSDSGGIDENNENSFLEQQLTAQHEAGIVTTPALKVNNRVLTECNSYYLLDSICWSYWAHNWTTAPKVCYQCSTCPNHIDCLTNNGVCDKNTIPKDFVPDAEDSKGSAAPKKKHPVRKLLLWLLFLMAAAGCYAYYKEHLSGGGGGRPALNGYFQLAGEGN